MQRFSANVHISSFVFVSDLLSLSLLPKSVSLKNAVSHRTMRFLGCFVCVLCAGFCHSISIREPIFTTDFQSYQQSTTDQNCSFLWFCCAIDTIWQLDFEKKNRTPFQMSTYFIKFLRIFCYEQFKKSAAKQHKIWNSQEWSWGAHFNLWLFPYHSSDFEFPKHFEFAKFYLKKRGIF